MAVLKETHQDDYLIRQRAFLSLLTGHPVDLPVMVVQCCGCGDAVEIARYGIAQVEGQIRLWCAGWRRNPDTAQDFCPACLP